MGKMRQKQRIFYFLCLLCIGTLVSSSAYATAKNSRRVTTSVKPTNDNLLNPEEALKSPEMQRFLEQMQPDGKVAYPDMWYLLGKQYYYGEANVGVDYNKTYEHWIKAAEAGQVAALHGMGILYLRGRGTIPSLPMAIEYFEKAAAKGFGPSFYQLGTIYLKGHKDLPKDSKKAFEKYLEGAKHNDLGSLYALGLLYYTGDGTEQNYEAAFKAWEKCAQSGNKEAQYNVGTMYENGQGVEKNLELAKQWYAKAAEKKHQAAATALKDLVAATAAKQTATQPAQAIQ